MSRRAAATLNFNGLVVLLLGLIAGAPYGAALVGNWGEEVARAWKLAHAEGVLNGLMILALAGCAPCLTLGRAAERVVVWGAVFVAFMFGMWSVLIAVPVAASGAWRQLRGGAGQ